MTISGDRVHDECGVVGVYSRTEDVARVAFFGLYALQHRGQESAGIATSAATSFDVRRDAWAAAQHDESDSQLGVRKRVSARSAALYSRPRFRTSDTGTRSLK